MEIAQWTCLGLSLLGSCTVVVVILFMRAKRPKQCHCEACIEQRESVDRIDEINQCISRGQYHQKCADARARELVELHGYSWESCEGEELQRVICDGQDYAETMQRIMRWRFPQRDVG